MNILMKHYFLPYEFIFLVSLMVHLIFPLFIQGVITEHSVSA